MVYKTLQGLSYIHKDTASAYTSIAILLFSLLKLRGERLKFSHLLIFLHVLLHAPHSIKYHAEHYLSTEEQNLENHKKDIIMIYISHIIMHIALSYEVPWALKSITLNIFILFTLLIIEKIEQSKTEANNMKISIGYSWIFLLHYIPIIYTNQWWFVLLHTVFYIIGFGIYTSKVIGNESINNALMHCGIIINNWFAFKFC